MKKLLALVIIAAFGLATLSGCPSATTAPKPAGTGAAPTNK